MGTLKRGALKGALPGAQHCRTMAEGGGRSCIATRTTVSILHGWSRDATDAGRAGLNWGGAERA